MSNAILNQDITPAPDLTESWGTPLAALVCERCDWRFLVPQSAEPQRCPHCFQPALTPVEPHIGQIPFAQPPELALPHALSGAQLNQEVQRFATGIPYPPQDLSAENLQARLNRMYLPMWLVDCRVRANWKAEAGFDYQVVSHQERYSSNGWISQQVKEPRVRWEPRLGRLERSYANIAAPALEEHAALREALGDFDLTAARPYQPQDAQGVFIRLPDRPPQDAWSDAQLALQRAAAEECRKAARADHLRAFAWQAAFHEQHWTQLLLPVYTAYYLDDDQKPQALLIHGQSGKIHGARRASMRRATRAALAWLGVAGLIFILGLALTGGSLVAPPLLPLGILGLTLALLIALGAVIPLGQAWWFNRNQQT
jgi:hypothetical protein